MLLEEGHGAWVSGDLGSSSATNELQGVANVSSLLWASVDLSEK